MEYKLTIPGRLPGMNEYINAERTNRFKGAKMKADAEFLVMACIMQQLPGVHIEQAVRVDYLWIEPNRKRDKDNISSYGRKVIQDSLVKAGTLKNDGWANITGFSDSFAVNSKTPSIQVFITEE